MTGNGRSSRRLIRPKDGRVNNIALVMQTLYDTTKISRAELARQTGLTRVTISDLIAELLNEGLVEEVGASNEVRPGKRATMLQVAAASRNIIAVDLSGEREVVGAIYSLRGVLCKRITRPLEGKRGSQAVDVLINLIRALVKASEKPVLGIGVGTPGTVDMAGGIVSAANLDWHFFNLAQEITGQTGLTVYLGNDANLAAVAERRFAQGSAELLRVQISRGVGSGLLLAGNLVHGTSGAAGEIGHTVIEYNGTKCSCGKRGCLETWISVPALNRRIAQDAAGREAILAEAGRRLGMALAPILGMLDFTDVLIGGPSDLIEGTFISAAQDLISERIGIESRRDVVLKLSTLGEDAVLLGATALVLRNQLGIY